MRDSTTPEPGQVGPICVMDANIRELLILLIKCLMEAMYRLVADPHQAGMHMRLYACSPPSRAHADAHHVPIAHALS